MTADTPLFSVMIVDDSAAAREFLRRMVDSDPALKVTAAVGSAREAADLMRHGLPDVMVLDLDLPEISGLAFLRRIMQQHPLPVVVCSAHVMKGAELSDLAVKAGAFEVLAKPRSQDKASMETTRLRLCAALKAAARSGLERRGGAKSGARAPMMKVSPDIVLPIPLNRAVIPVTEPVVCIGASTGGTEALREVLAALPPDAPGIAVVQHMPEMFTGAFAQRLSSLCRIEVTEAEQDMILRPGLAVIAPGDRHLILRRGPKGYRCHLVDGPAITRHKPSVDILFRSAALAAGANAMGIIMTGMGDDGAMCLGEMRRAGAVTLAQDEASSVVFGMPREALQMGSAARALPLSKLADAIMIFARKHRLMAGKDGVL
jgi:two-component system chemotaxis response regulator CheB